MPYNAAQLTEQGTGPGKTIPLQPPSSPADTTAASIPDTLARLRVDPETGLTNVEVEIRRKTDGFNEVAEKKAHPVLLFLGKFWGLSAWMLELIIVLSIITRNIPDLVVVGVLLVVNAVLSFTQEHRAAGVGAWFQAG